jgi:hypothetical protein
MHIGCFEQIADFGRLQAVRGLASGGTQIIRFGAFPLEPGGLGDCHDRQMSGFADTAGIVECRRY